MREREEREAPIEPPLSSAKISSGGLCEREEHARARPPKRFVQFVRCVCERERGRQKERKSWKERERESESERERERARARSLAYANAERIR